LGRKAYGFEIDRKIYKEAKDWYETVKLYREEIKLNGFSSKLMAKQNPDQPLLLNTALIG